MGIWSVAGEYMEQKCCKLEPEGTRSQKPHPQVMLSLIAAAARDLAVIAGLLWFFLWQEARIRFILEGWAKAGEGREGGGFMRRLVGGGLAWSPVQPEPQLLS